MASGTLQAACQPFRMKSFFATCGESRRSAELRISSQSGLARSRRRRLPERHTLLMRIRLAQLRLFCRTCTNGSLIPTAFRWLTLFAQLVAQQFRLLILLTNSASRLQNLITAF